MKPNFVDSCIEPVAPCAHAVEFKHFADTSSGSWYEDQAGHTVFVANGSGVAVHVPTT